MHFVRSIDSFHSVLVRKWPYLHASYAIPIESINHSILHSIPLVTGKSILMQPVIRVENCLKCENTYGYVLGGPASNWHLGYHQYHSAPTQILPIKITLLKSLKRLYFFLWVLISIHRKITIINFNNYISTYIYYTTRLFLRLIKWNRTTIVFEYSVNNVVLCNV